MARVGDVQQLLGSLYAAPLQPQMWNLFLQRMSEVTGISKAALLAHDFEAGDHRMLATVGDTVAESVPLYENHYYQFDEWTKRFAKHRRFERFVQGEELWPDGLMVKSVFFNEFLEPFDVCQMASFVSVGGAGMVDALSVYRGPQENPFDRELLAFLQMLVPHLGTALCTRRRLAGQEARINDLQSALDQITSALVLLDSRCRCIFLNRAAKSILDQRNGLYLERSMLCVRNVTESNRLRDALASATALVHGTSMRAPNAVSISRLGRRPLSVLAAPFTTDATTGAGRATAIVFLNDPEQKATLPSEVLRMLFGLTVSEARLALTLLDGNSLSEAASVHEVTQETVRSQVKSIFQKTGTKRQGELLQLLSGLTSPRL